jgi:hypothetical protein
MLNVSDVKEGMKIEYIGDSIAFGGKYHVHLAETTYVRSEDCPEHEKGRLLIVEFMNDETPMFFFIDEDINPKDWVIVDERCVNK